MRVTLLLGLVSAVLCGQQPEVQQKTAGPCSVAIVGSNNQVFTCKGMDKKSGDQILQILNRIAENQLDPNAVMAKLDEIQRGVNEIRENTTPRMLDDAAFSRVVTKLTSHQGQKANVTYMINDNESGKLAERIYDAMVAARWTVTPPSAAMIFPTPGAKLPGIRLSVAQETPAGLAILNALHSEGLSVLGAITKNIEPDVIGITVFTKP